MRLVTVILIATLMQVSAAGFAQRLTMQKSQASLKEVFTEIKKQTGYNVVWDSELLKNSKPVEAKFNNEEVCKVLDQILVNQNLDYTITDNTIVIKENKKPSFLENFFDRFNNIDVSGKILDENGKPLPGASVKVKKTGKGVSTDKDGRFFLKGVEEGDVLVVSFIGYLPKEVIASTNMGNVVLEQSLSKLDEVQVIAYGTTTQRLSTGNVTTIKADVIEKQPVNNPLLALQGRVPGLFIEQATGFAGTGVKVRIQGRNSLSYGSDPFYVVDGIPYPSQLIDGANPILGESGNGGVFGTPLSFINPSDIESIDILKDADATAIYGSRAANGAILITTKKGKSGNTKTSINLQSGWGKVSRKVNLMNSQQYLDMRRIALRNDGIAAPNSGPYSDSDLNGNWDNSRYTDWQKELIGGTAGYQDMNASVSGGSDRSTFLVGAGYHRETNVFPGDYADQKGSLHFSINNASINQRFKILLSGSYLFDHNRLPAIDFTRNAMSLAPVAPPLYQSDGSINWQGDSSGSTTFGSNPMGNLFNQFLSKTSNLTSNLNLSYSILSDLELKSSFGYNTINSETTNKTYINSVPPELTPYFPRSTAFGNNQSYTWSIEPQISYKKDISKGELEVLLGATTNQQRRKGLQMLGFGFLSDQVMDDLMSAPNTRVSSTVGSLYKYNALFGRINYNWEDKYIVNLSWRRDGSSRFGPKSQFHNFAAIGGAWIFSKEKFIQDHLTFISFGKLRGSYGTTGSDQIPDYQFLSLYKPVAQPVPYQGSLIYQPNGLTNPYLQWEETRKTQFGLDLGFINDRLLFNMNYYRNFSSNQLSNYTLPATTGSGFILRNQNYKIQNSGWEFGLSNLNVHYGDFRWASDLNLTIPKTLLVDYPDIIKSSAASTAIIGRPISAIYVYHFLGVDPATGKYQFADKDGNPTFTPRDPDDKIAVIDLSTKFYGGIQNTFSYKNIQLDFLFSFVKKTVVNTAVFGYGIPGNFNGGTNQPAFVSKSWTNPGDISRVQKFTTGYDLYQGLDAAYQSDAAVVDASYIRLKNVSLSWTVPDRWKKCVGLYKCNLFIQGQNLLTITGYTGLDPESVSSFTLPPLRVITLGLKVEM